MPAAELKEALIGADGITVRAEEPLAHHLPLRIGGPVELWINVHDEDALVRATKAARANNSVWRVHWPFQDWLVRDGGLKGAVLRLGRGFEHITLSQESLTTPNSEMSSAGKTVP